MLFEWEYHFYSAKEEISDHALVQALLHYRTVAPDLREMYALQQTVNGSDRARMRPRRLALEAQFNYRTVAQHQPVPTAIPAKMARVRAAKAEKRAQGAPVKYPYACFKVPELEALIAKGDTAATVELERRRTMWNESAKRRKEKFDTVLTQYESGHAVNMGLLDQARQYYARQRKFSPPGPKGARSSKNRVPWTSAEYNAV